MNEKRTSATKPQGQDLASKQDPESKETSQSPQAGDMPTGQTPQGTQAQKRSGGTYQPEEGGKGGSGYQPGESERAEGTTSRPGQVEGKGGQGDRTNLSGLGGPDKSNWNRDTGRGTDGS